jgi:hypothetical protein
MMHANHSGDAIAYSKHKEIIRLQSKPPLPPPLSTFDEVNYCSSKTKPYLDLEASDYASDSKFHRHDRAIGSYAVVIPPYNATDVMSTVPESIIGWMVFDDKKG